MINSQTFNKWMLQKQPLRGVPRKRCSVNMQQIYRRTSMPKCDFNKVAKQLYWNYILAWVFPCEFAAYFQNTFFLLLKSHFGMGVLLWICCIFSEQLFPIIEITLWPGCSSVNLLLLMLDNSLISIKYLRTLKVFAKQQSSELKIKLL